MSPSASISIPIPIPTLPPPPTPPDWDAFSRELLLLYTASRQPKTTQRMRQVLALARACAASPAELTPSAVAAFILAARMGPGSHDNTVATKVSYLRRACSYAVAMGYLASSPFGAWKGFVRWRPSGPATVHSPGAIGKVLGSLLARSADSPEAGRLHAWAWLLAHTGLRRDEALFLRVEDLDLAGATVTVRRRLKRPTTARTIPLPPGLPAVLAGWLPRRPDPAGTCPWVFPNRRGNPWSGGACGYRPIDKLRAAGERAGVKDFTPKSLRHSFATIAATLWMIPPATLQRWMGHTDIRTTMKYYVHLDISTLIAASLSVAFPAA
jgi:integrase